MQSEFPWSLTQTQQSKVQQPGCLLTGRYETQTQATVYRRRLWLTSNCTVLWQLLIQRATYSYARQHHTCLVLRTLSHKRRSIFMMLYCWEREIRSWKSLNNLWVIFEFVLLLNVLLLLLFPRAFWFCSPLRIYRNIPSWWEAVCIPKGKTCETDTTALSRQCPRTVCLRFHSDNTAAEVHYLSACNLDILLRLWNKKTIF